MNKPEEFSKFEMPRFPSESAKAHTARMDYVLMGADRSMDKLLAIYQRRHRDKSEVMIPTKNKTTMYLWSSKYQWSTTAKEFDNYEAARLFEERLEQRRAEFEQQLQEFHRHHLMSGKRAFKVAAASTKQILEFVEQNPQIDSWEDCVRAASIVKAIFPIADLWAKCLSLERLLDNLDLADI